MLLFVFAVLLHQPLPRPHHLYVFVLTLAAFVLQLGSYVYNIFLLDPMEIEKVCNKANKNLTSVCLFLFVCFLLSFSHSINHHELSNLFFTLLEMISG